MALAQVSLAQMAAEDSRNSKAAWSTTLHPLALHTVFFAAWQSHTGMLVGVRDSTTHNTGLHLYLPLGGGPFYQSVKDSKSEVQGVVLPL